jgi:hypothetical protein
VQALQSNPEALAAYPDWDEIGPDSALIQHRQLPDYDIENMLVDFNVSIGPGVFIRRSSIERFGTRDPQFKYVGDLEFWSVGLHGKLRIFKDLSHIGFIPVRHPALTKVTWRMSW